MNTRCHVVTLLLVAALVAELVATPSFAARSRRDVSPPLEVTLEPLSSLLPGSVARFRVAVVPRFPADEVRVTVSTPPAIAWVTGERVLRRATRRDERSALEFSVRVPTTGRYPLHVAIEAMGPGGITWRRGVGVGLGVDPRSARARVVADGRGGQTVEYEAAPAEPGRALREDGR